MSVKPGRAVIFSFEHFEVDNLRDLPNSPKDIEKLTSCFSKYCDIEVYQDLKRDEFHSELNRFSESLKASTDVKFVVVFIGSHGGLDYFNTSDGKKIQEKEVYGEFKDIRMPKVFLLQHCREKTDDVGGDPNPHVYSINNHNLLKHLPENSFVAYATTPGRESWVFNDGSVFITDFKKAFDERVQLSLATGLPQLDVCRIMSRTNDIMSRRLLKSMPPIKVIGHFASKMEKQFYFDK